MARLAPERDAVVFTNATLADVTAARRLRIESGWVAVRGSRIHARGTGAPPRGLPQLDLEGRLVTAGLIECHTHLLFAGNRVGDVLARMGEAAADGRLGAGGIRATAAATAAASDEDLLELLHRRLAAFAAQGVTTVEVKSGYGLTSAAEARLLELAVTGAHRARRELGVDVRVTYLGLHALPRAPHARHEAIEDACALLDRLPAEVRLVDAFVDPHAATVAEGRRFLEAARARGLGVRLHADQFGDAGGALLAAELGALGADHLDHASPEGVRALARAQTVAVVTPFASIHGGTQSRPPVEQFRRAGVRIACSSDANPGTAPSVAVRTAALLALALWQLHPLELFAGLTREAGRALGLTDRGAIEPAMRADLVAWDASHPYELVATDLPLAPIVLTRLADEAQP